VSTITSPAGLVPLSAPLPTKRDFTLLDAAQVITPESDRWLGGAWIEGYAPGPAETHDPCSTGTYRAKDETGVIARPMVGAFTVYRKTTCTAVSVGPDPTRFIERLRLIFQTQEPTAVERVFATGDGHSTLGPYLADTNLELLAAGAAQTPIEGLALLEDELAAVGGSGMIHVAPATATYWAGEGLIEAARGQMRTKLGTLIAVGAGYRGAYPDGEAAPGAGEEWAFATGPVSITRGEILTIPNEYSEALDRSSNDATFLVERNYLISWVGRQDTVDDDHLQAGVLIDRTP
jgi:hypothetical protein